MKKSFNITNLILIISILVGDLLFILSGTHIISCEGLISKSIASLLFVILGVFHFMLAKKQTNFNKKFAILMLTGLIFAMLGDILLEIVFVTGAG